MLDYLRKMLFPGWTLNSARRPLHRPRQDG